ncbi:precorrin-6y C5,15-methyltransferase (decarboxylating) subunit CbiE [Gymnodinialimonas hymeniacidonis]|uniref:precorrin-6y C5,15-methyltransferase (decarboxylating) subunit CbiE n=1 Tax=Gymnodinialimonas hymeniacidonis TaxID=3126508 RepID=UPI0034C61381
MAEPWITIIGLGEDGPEGLSAASRDALETADVVMGPPRHLAMVDAAEKVEWPVPFADGYAVLEGLRGSRVVVLASGDPFWFGAGRGIAAHFPGQWRAFPGVSIFGLVAARLGWSLEDVTCVGLHAAPFAQMRRALAPGARVIATLRDGAAVSDVARYLRDLGFGGSELFVCEAMGGPRERVSRVSVAEAMKGGFSHPVAVGLSIAGDGAAVPKTSGLPDDLFETDGVMTKRPLRAMTLSALAPRHGEHLWDIGGGSGSIAVEWLLADASCWATIVEPREDRCALIRANAGALGVEHRLEIVQGTAPEVFTGLDAPDVVFVGGGTSPALRTALWASVAEGTRILFNAVTLETEALLVGWQAQFGGELMKVEISTAAPMGGKRGWKAAYPVVQWSVVR